MKATIRAVDLCRLIEDCLPFAGADDALPILTVIHIELGDDGIMTASSTDRYAMAQSRTHVERTDEYEKPCEIEAGIVNIARRDAQAIVRNYKPTRSSGIRLKALLRLTLTDEPNGKVLHVAQREDYAAWPDARINMGVRHIDGPFPPIAKIIPDTKETEAIALNPRYLNAAGRRQRDRHDALRITFAGHNKPARIALGSSEGDDELRIYVMPVRIGSVNGWGDWS